MQGTAIAVLALLSVHATDPTPAPGESAAPSAPSATAPPKLPPEGKRWLDSFVGRFASSDVTMTLGDRPTKGKMELDCRRAAAGWASVCTATMTLGKEKQHLALLYGWDVAAGTAHLFEVNDMGEVHDHAGKWQDDHTITVARRGKAPDGTDEEDSLTFALTGPKQVRVTGQGSAGGKTLWIFAGTFTKR